MDVVVLVFAGALLGGAWAAPASKVSPPELVLQPPLQNVAPATYITRHHAQDELGQVNYGFSHPGQSKNEVRDASGNVAGAYSYVDADDKVVVVEYTAGEGGFQVASNNLPVAVSDTPEVLAAKLQFVEQYNAAALAAATASQDVDAVDLPSEDSETFNVGVPVTVVSSPVKDTPEVIAAKLQFVEAYNAAALAAAQAPDDVNPSVNAEFRTKEITNHNPVKDTPEVTDAKLKFVEAYNAAALAAAKAAENPNVDGASKVTIVYAIPVVKDTPEVKAAKLNFVEKYNQAALEAARAASPDEKAEEDKTDSTSYITENPSAAEEPVTTLGVYVDQKSESSSAPDEVSEDADKDSRKFVPIIPVKVESSNNFPIEEIKFGATNIPQAHSYGVGSPKGSEDVDIPSVRISVVPDHASQSVAQDQIGTKIPIVEVNQHHLQDELGQVNYGFSYPGHSKNEIRFTDGSVVGVYSYTDDENKVNRVEYTAGKDGFQVKSNNLPVAVSYTPEVLAASLKFVEDYNSAALAVAQALDEDTSDGSPQMKTAPVISNPVKDTPEVLAAKLQFVKLYNAAALAAANAPDDETESTGLGGDEPEGVKFINANPVKDTPEVTAAKLQFVEAYNAAALAAAEADDPTHDTPKATIVYAPHGVQDTPEVIAAKLKFVEAYNAAALAAALAPDDDIQAESALPQIVGDGSQGILSIPDEVQIISAPQVLEESFPQVPVISPVSSGIGENTLASPVIVTHEVPVVQGYSEPVVSNQPAVSPVVVPSPLPTNLQVPTAAFPITYVSRHHAQDELGQVNYGFSHPGQAKNEVRDASGNVEGTYSYIDSDDKVIEVRYTAGEDGFQVKSNNLPVAPSDTPEVLAAKLQFVEAYNAAALAAASAPDDELPASAPSVDSLFIPPTPVKDTPEVLSAKLQFVEDYNAAALAAANAPDDPVQYSSDDSKPVDGMTVDLNPVQDTPEITAAKLQFVEAYNAAALAAAKADGLEPPVSIVYAPHAVQDTPEVIAAKLKFVEAYNAAALLAALAPDDEVTVQDPVVVETPTVFTDTEVLSPEISSDVTEVEQSVYIANEDIPDTSVNEIVEEQTGNAGQQYTVDGSAPYLSPILRYAGYPAQPDGSIPTLYTYSVPYSVFGLYPSTLQKGSMYTSFIPFQSADQKQGSVNNHIIMYAPLHYY